MRIFILIIAISFSNMLRSQAQLNDYKYIIIPKHFETFKEENQYQTSTLIKFLLTERNFDVIYDDELPQDLNSNRCLGLLAKLNDESSMFTTKTSISFKNCHGVEVFVTQEGKSKIKEFKSAYSEAIRNALKSLNGVNYRYTGKAEEQQTLTASFKNDVKSLKNKQVAEKLEPKGINTEKVERKAPKNQSPMIIQEATTENQSYKNLEPVVSDVGSSNGTDVSKDEEIWYAQEISNGYQLVDSTPKIRMKLFKSSNDNMYMAQSEGKSGMVYQKNGQWIFEYYEGESLVQKPLNIKF